MRQFLLLFLVIPLFTFGQWDLMGLDIDGEAEQDSSGSSISISSSGTILAIGAFQNDSDGLLNTGHVRVYEWNGASWEQLGIDIDGEAQFDSSGVSIDLNSNGTILAIGAFQNSGNGDYSGHVRVYEWNGASWAQKGSDIDGEAAGDYSGRSVSLNSDGTILVIGAYGNDGNGADAGHVRVYEWNGASWDQKGSDIDGEAAGDFFGTFTTLNGDGTILAIGAHSNDGNGADAGHVRVYEWNGAAWIQKGSDIDGEAAGDFSGISSLSNDGNILAIGAFTNDGNGIDAGHVRVFQWTGAVWDQMGSDIEGAVADDRFGRSVSLNNVGSILAAGAYLNDGNVVDSGHVRVFQWTGSSWDQLGADIEGETFNDYSGIATRLNSDGSIVAIGAHYNDGNGTQSGHVRVYSNASLSIEENNFGSKFKAYPNPSFEDVSIELGSIFQEVEISIFDLLGKEVMRETYTNTNKIELDTQLFTTGVYIVKVESNTNKASLKLIVK